MTKIALRSITFPVLACVATYVIIIIIIIKIKHLKALNNENAGHNVR